MFVESRYIALNLKDKREVRKVVEVNALKCAKRNEVSVEARVRVKIKLKAP